MPKTCQKYGGALVTTALPRFPEAGKQSKGVGGSLGTPHLGTIPAETMMQWMERQEVLGHLPQFHSDGSYTLYTQIRYSSAHWSKCALNYYHRNW